ncbi:MAG: HD domain-containing protein, partial [Planctomycetes bacterium]|nr:HD domain-containing protein [Planctomycetota bacterium]
GVPDAILRKPGPLTEQEWKVMGAHDRMGEEIINAAFNSATLTRIVRSHHAWFGGNPRNPDLPTGTDIPLEARILAIADAFDAMTTDRVYRRGRSREEAFVELRRWAGKQFDPELVEHFLEVMLARDDSRDLPFPALSKRAAFKIGLQIEKLASALDAKDMTNLAAMASCLKGTASENRLPQIFEVAAHLEQAVASQADWLEIIEYSSDLLELCRSTQKSYLLNHADLAAATAV